MRGRYVEDWGTKLADGIVTPNQRIEQGTGGECSHSDEGAQRDLYAGITLFTDS